MNAAPAIAADTIFALSSGAPPAGIALIRVSGARAMATAERLAGALPPPRRAAHRRFHDPDGGLIDRGLLLRFPGPATATGEDLVELHLHGGRAVVARMLAVLALLPGLRPAEPGEFTRRAYLNGRIDLLEAEALGDLLSAETEGQRRAAIRMADGAFGRQIDRWRATALQLSAMVEASLDFGDEDAVDIDAGAPAQAAGRLAAEMRALLAAPPVERLRDGVAVVLGGPPNAGKSSLLNRLVGRDAAIVSAEAGTTRDIVEVPVAIGGTAFLFSDTAGLRDDAGTVEQIGIARARDRIAAADLLLWLGDDPPPPHPAALWLLPRSDLRAAGTATRLAVSVRTGAGIDALVGWLVDQAARLLPAPDALALSRRQRAELAVAADAAAAAAIERDAVLQAEALRQMRAAFDRLTGRAGFEDLLDSLFGQFCLGK